MLPLFVVRVRRVPERTPTPERAVEAAMAQVLAAESAARESVASARVEARQIAERSRAAARAVGERTQRRIGHLRAAFERAADAEVAALQAQSEALVLVPGPAPDEAARIEHAVVRVAAELTGASP